MRTPIIEEILKIKNKNPLSYHTPGHKNGLVGLKPLDRLWPAEVWGFDLTEIATLDNLHLPSGCILEAEKLAADFFGAQETFFLINGTTVGLQSAILALARKKQLFVPRNAHKSIYNGAILADAEIISLPVSYDENQKIPLGVEPEILENYIRANPQCKTIILPNPNYYGISYKVEENLAVAKNYGLTVILDEAHGSHFRLGTMFPKTGLSLGADIVVQSWHKTLPALTQASVLHVGQGYQGPDLRSYISMLQTTSPSYLLLAALDASRAFLEAMGQQDIYRICQNIVELGEQIKALGSFQVGIETSEPQDPLKLIISSPKLEGYQLERLLIDDYDIYGELATKEHILLIMGLTTDRTPHLRLYKALEEISHLTKGYPKKEITENKLLLNPRYQSAMSIGQAFYSAKELVPVGNCVGRVCGQFILKYPPGIPQLLPGEVITKEIFQDLVTLDNSEEYIQVIRT